MYSSLHASLDVNTQADGGKSLPKHYALCALSTTLTPGYREKEKDVLTGIAWHFILFFFFEVVCVNVQRFESSPRRLW